MDYKSRKHSDENKLLPDKKDTHPFPCYFLKNRELALIRLLGESRLPGSYLQANKIVIRREEMEPRYGMFLKRQESGHCNNLLQDLPERTLQKESI